MFKNALTLCLISLVAALALGFVNELTKDRIAQLEMEKKAEAYRAVFPEAVGILEKGTSDVLDAALEDAAEILTTGGYSAATLEEACVVVDANQQVIGYIASVTVKGYDVMTLTFGYTTEGVCTGLEFLSIVETPGLGMRADETEFKSQFVNRKADSFTVVKSGAAAPNEIDALSGATMTTNGVVDGINAGICFFNELEKRIAKAGGVQ